MILACVKPADNVLKNRLVVDMECQKEIFNFSPAEDGCDEEDGFSVDADEGDEADEEPVLPQPANTTATVKAAAKNTFTLLNMNLKSFLTLNSINFYFNAPLVMTS